jgi:hypothetical protein
VSITLASTATTCSATKGGATDQRLEPHAPEREEIRATVDVAAGHHLLGGHVRGRSDHDAGARERGDVAAGRDAEVDEHGARGVPVAQEDVAGFDVAMDHARVVHGRERLGDALDHRDAARDGERASPDEMHAEVDAVEPLHREPWRAVLRAPVAHEADDVWMRNLREKLAFALEAPTL